MRRIGEGCLKASIMYREVTAQGFIGSYAIVRKFIEQYPQQIRSDDRAPSADGAAGDRMDLPTSRQTWSSATPSSSGKILDRCAQLRTAVELVRSFADMLTHLHGERLTAWIAAAEQAAFPGITKFATGLTADIAAVTAGLNLSFSSGPVETDGWPCSD
jgi:transposase